MIIFHRVTVLAGVTSLQGIIPFEKGIILFVKRNHSFFDKESFLAFSGIIPCFFRKAFLLIKECFPTNKGMLSLKLGKLSSL